MASLTQLSLLTARSRRHRVAVVRGEWLRSPRCTSDAWSMDIYDVQPTPGDLTRNGTSRGSLIIRDGAVIRGRGVTDSKGPVLIDRTSERIAFT
jgi:hypothetical protein